MIGPIVAFEWYRWRHRRGSWMTAVFLLLATLLYAWITRTIASTGLASASASAPGGAPGFQLAFKTAGGMARMLSIFALAWGAFALAPELDKGWHRMPLLRAPRGHLLCGKALFLGVIVAVLALAIMLLSLGMGASSGGLGPVHIGDLVVHSRDSLLGSGFVAALLAVFPLVTLVALGLAVSAVARSGEMALFLSIMITAVLWGVSLLPGAGSVVFMANAGWPFAVASSRSEGLRTMSFSDGGAAFMLTNVAWTAGFLALALVSFRRRDLP